MGRQISKDTHWTLIQRSSERQARTETHMCFVELRAGAELLGRRELMLQESQEKRSCAERKQNLSFAMPPLKAVVGPLQRAEESRPGTCRPST